MLSGGQAVGTREPNVLSTRALTSIRAPGGATPPSSRGRYKGWMVRRDIVRGVASGLARLGIIERDRFRETVELAWPRVVTGLAIMSKQTADLAMVGIAVGTSGVAGLAFALAYWGFVKFAGIGITGGTVSLVSQNYGAGEPGRASRALGQSVLVALAVAVPVVLVLAGAARPLIGIFGGDPVVTRHGTVYLAVVAPGLLFEFLNLVASRTYAGVGDTFTPMVVRAGGGVANILLSGLFIFGFGLGVAGAALGTLVATGLVCCVLAWGVLGRSYGVAGLRPCPTPLRGEDLRPDPELGRQLVVIAAPLVGRHLAAGLFVFPLLWVGASFGSVVVAALEVARRVRALLNSLNWGLTTAASTLVGQSLGAGEEREAGGYGWDIIRLAFVSYLALGLAAAVLADPIAALFVSDPTHRPGTATFVRVAAVSAVALGVDGAVSGVLRGAGDTRVPFVASLLGRYAFALPAALLGLFTPLGVAGLYAALVLEVAVPAVLNTLWFRTDNWKLYSRAFRPGAEPE
jgi:putative MATE family efflux protein